MNKSTGHPSYCTGHSQVGYLNGFNATDFENFFVHYDFPFAKQKSATISLKSYGSKIHTKPCSLKAVEVVEMTDKKISPETEQVLIGSSLGDGGLRLPKNGKNAIFKEMHSAKQEKYLMWKKNYLSYFKPKVNRYKIYDNRTKKNYHSAVLWTRVDPILTNYFRLFYPNGKKRISNDILNKVKPLALAVWYCDDGSFGYINQNAKIATYLSYEDNELIAKFLKKKFDINCSINKDGEHYHIYFSVKEIKKFLGLVKGYIPKCMNYKLGPFSEENVKKLKEENLKRRERDKVRHKRDMANPIKRRKINRQKQENHKKRMQNSEYRKRYNEYQKIKQRQYRKKKGTFSR